MFLYDGDGGGGYEKSDSTVLSVCANNSYASVYTRQHRTRSGEGYGSDWRVLSLPPVKSAQKGGREVKKKLCELKKVEIGMP